MVITGEMRYLLPIIDQIIFWKALTIGTETIVKLKISKQEAVVETYPCLTKFRWIHGDVSKGCIVPYLYSNCR